MHATFLISLVKRVGERYHANLILRVILACHSTIKPAICITVAYGITKPSSVKADGISDRITM